jgi:hypothetical protein
MTHLLPKLLTTIFFFIISLSVSASEITFELKVKMKDGTFQSSTVTCDGANGGTESRDCRRARRKVNRRVTLEYNLNRAKQGASDFGNQFREDLREAGQEIRSDAKAVGDAVGNAARATGEAAGKAVRATGEVAGNAVRATGEAIRNASNATVKVVRGAVDKVNGQAYRVKLPGHDHEMVYHCFGGQESKECKSELEEVVAAIKSGTDKETLEAYRLRHVSAGVERIKTGISWAGHKSCKDKLARHARDFDSSYENKFLTGQHKELVSYMEKMEYIRVKLVEEKRFEDCKEHFISASLGYQLEWAAGGELVQKDTHIFDGVGFHKGGMGYWKSEQRDSSYGERAAGVSGTGQ